MGDSYTLLDILIRLGLEDLQELARRSGSIASPSRRSLSAQVLAQYRDRNFIRRIVRALPKEAMGLLGFLVLLQDQSRQGLQGRTQWEDYPEQTQHLDALLHAGLLFHFPDENSEPIIPEEIIPAIRDTLLELEQNEPSVQEERLWGGTERILLMQFRLLAAVQKGRFRQTPANLLGKRELEQWLGELPNDVFPPNSIPNMIDPQTVADFLLSAGLQSGLIDRWKGELRITNEIFDWLRQDRGTLTKNLWNRFVRSVAIRYPAWYIPLFCAVYAAENEQVLWRISPSSATGYRGTLAVWLSWFGLVRVSRQAGGVIAVRTSAPVPWESGEKKSVEQGTTLGTLQPNFELMVSPDTPLDLLWEIERFADHDHTDVVSIYRLNRESIIRGLKDGLSADEIRNYIKNLTSNRIPQNVQFSLAEWFHSYGRVEVEEVLLLRCRDAQVAEEVLHISESEGYIRERLGPNLLAAEPEKIEQLIEMLERLGLTPVVRLSKRDGA